MQPPCKAVLLGCFLTLVTLLATISWIRRCAVGAQSGPDLLDRQSQALAGPNAVDFGTVPVRGDPKIATDCALAAQKAGKPFLVRYDLMGFDSAVTVAIARTPIGTVGALNCDGDPAGAEARAHEVICPKRCPEPVHLWVNPSG